MKHTGLKEFSIEDILKHYNLIVPEIQREYVWGFNTHNIIHTFLDDIKETRHNNQTSTTDSSKAELLKIMDNPVLDEVTKSRLEAILNDSTDDVSEMNIGFLYSYRPSYSDGSKDNDLYLIDGQQRFTTLFLLLFYFAIKEGKLDDFNELFKVNISKSSLAFDYRVRSLTHQFFVELLKNISTVEGLMTLRQQTWFLNNYSQDVTVNSICGNDDRKSVFQIFHDHFEQEHKKYFDYIKSKIKFWHFKTEETSQGEELYITMNSRGQQLADNENIRAKLFDSDEVKSKPLYWSEKWELWQDFFWKNRDKKKKYSADEGFNEFLRWCQLLTMIEINSHKNDKELDAYVKIQQSINSNLDTQYLSLTELDLNFESLKFLQDYFQNDIQAALENYPKFKSKFKFSFNHFTNGTFLSQNQLFLILPLIKYCKTRIKNKHKIEPISLLRVYQFLNNLLQDVTVTKSIRDQVVNIVEHISLIKVEEEIDVLIEKEKTSKTIINEEQICKLSIYKNFSNDRIANEDLFWYTETLNYVNGSISHFIKFLFKTETSYSFSEFSDYITSLDYFLKNENALWGELIPTNVYTISNDKVQYVSDFIKRQGLLNLVLELMKSKNPPINEFCKDRQKEWFKNTYDNQQMLENESDKKNQIYLIYILKHNHFFKLAKWNWFNGRFSFGVWQSYTNCKTIFLNGFIYQMIKFKFVENSSYIFDYHYKKLTSEKVFLELTNWTKHNN